MPNHQPVAGMSAAGPRCSVLWALVVPAEAQPSDDTLTKLSGFRTRGPTVHFEQSLTDQIILIVPHVSPGILFSKHFHILSFEFCTSPI